MDAFVGQTRRIKWVYDSGKQGVSDLTLTIRDESDAIVFGPEPTQGLYGGVYYADWTPTEAGSFTGYFESVNDPVGTGVFDIIVTVFQNSVNTDSQIITNGQSSSASYHQIINGVLQ